MDISNISGISKMIPSIDGNQSTSEDSIFSQIYDQAIQMVNDTNTLQHDADQASVDFALGNIDNVHDVMIAQEKASIALQYTVQLKNSLLDAYNEIMNMQV